ncbi:MAG: hypothetical protein KUG59_05865, partial [Parvibaculaceae bacterium]|nr:hypothetical protein [Parvibaculaceae bacterium]
HRGQTMAAFSVVFQLVPAIFGLIAGVVANAFDVPTALTLIGLIIVTGLSAIIIFARSFAGLGSLKAR